MCEVEEGVYVPVAVHANLTLTDYVCGAMSPAGRKGRLTLIDRGVVHSR